MHLTDWPEADLLPKDADLVAAMDQVREVCSVGSSLRKAKKLRVRLPLPKLTVAVDDPAQLAPFTDLIADELNVKAVELTDDIDAYGRFELTVNARAAGPRIGKDVQAAIKAVKAGEGVLNDDGTLTAGPATLLPEEYSSKLVAAEPEWTAALPDGAGLVVLDGTVTPELEAEGWAKDRIRELQDLRKSSGLDVSDRISVTMSVPAEKADWAQTHRDLIAGEILATSFEFGRAVGWRRTQRSATASGWRSLRRDVGVQQRVERAGGRVQRLVVGHGRTAFDRRGVGVGAELGFEALERALPIGHFGGGHAVCVRRIPRRSRPRQGALPTRWLPVDASTWIPRSSAVATAVRSPVR